MSSKEIIEINQFLAESTAIRCCMHQIPILCTCFFLHACMENASSICFLFRISKRSFWGHKHPIPCHPGRTSERSFVPRPDIFLPLAESIAYCACIKLSTPFFVPFVSPGIWNAVAHKSASGEVKKTKHVRKLQVVAQIFCSIILFQQKYEIFLYPPGCISKKCSAEITEQAQAAGMFVFIILF
jgi:hypothetical protein